MVVKLNRWTNLRLEFRPLLLLYGCVIADASIPVLASFWETGAFFNLFLEDVPRHLDRT